MTTGDHDPTPRPATPGRSSRLVCDRTRRQRPIVRERRGAVLVWAGVVVLAMVGFGAMAVDIGSFYVTTAEIQTAADAGALAGARRLQVTTSGTLAEIEALVDARAMDVTNSNRAWGVPLGIDANAVDVGWWNPTTRAFGLTIPAGRSPNAVRVTTRRQTGFLFGQVLQRVFGTAGPPLLQRQAVAWVANLNRAPCVQPWALPYNVLYKVATGTVATGTDTPMLTQAQLAALANKTETERIARILGPNPDHLTNVGTLPYDGRWRAFSYGNTVGNAQYERAISCSLSYDVTLSEVNQQGGSTLPSQGNNVYERSTEQGFTRWLQNAQPGDDVPRWRNNTDARCYTDAAFTELGCRFTVVWGIENGTGPNGWNGSSAITFKTMGRFVMLCYFRGNPGETCADPRVPAPQSGYPVGTIIGIVQGLAPIIIESSTTLGNVISDQQKLVLTQ